MPNVLSVLSVAQYTYEEDLVGVHERPGIGKWEVGMEWGTVMVFVCENDCDAPMQTEEVQYFEEICMIQYETV